jgi:hypothetical protein
MKKIRLILLLLLVVTIAMQFFRPERANPPVDRDLHITAALDVPADVMYLLERACADCHSHSTEWPWYTNVAPVSWVIAHHVDHGRECVNFDQWATYTEYEMQKVLDEIAEEVDQGKMPLPAYLRMHAEARLSDGDRARIVTWAGQERDRIIEKLSREGGRRPVDDDHGSR